MQLKIITHEKIVYEGDVDEIVIDTKNGQMGILKERLPITTILDIGITKAKQGDTVLQFATMGGIFQFKENVATILTDACEADCDIDVARAKEAKKRAEARLADADAEIDAQRAQAALARALVRLKASISN